MGSGTFEYPEEVVYERVRQQEVFQEEHRQTVLKVAELATQVGTLEEEHSEFVNQILENAPERYDGEESADFIAITYLRDLENAVTIALEAFDLMSRTNGPQPIPLPRLAETVLLRIKETTRRDNPS